MLTQNLFKDLPSELPKEVFESIVSNDKLRIERILSDGHSSPSSGWYDQDQDEWVLLLQGSGTLAFEDDSSITLNPGDHLLIPKNKKHRVTHTAPRTIWLAVHYG